MTAPGKIYAPHFARIPQELKVRRQWVVWKAVWQADKGKYNKIPVNPKGGYGASHADPLTWGTFGEAVAAYERKPRKAEDPNTHTQYAGIGYVLAPADVYTGIDLDYAVVDGSDGKKQLTPDAKRFVNLLASYTEISPSGNGLRIIVQATLPPGGRKTASVEMYDTLRFVTMTGRTWYDSPLAIAGRQDEVNAMHREVFPAPSAEEMAAKRARREVKLDLSDGELLQKAFAAKNGHGVNALYYGDLSAYAGDHSSADLGLCSKLAFWSGGDANRLDEWFRASRLMRDKWDKPHFASGETYGERTIAVALDGAREFYAPKGSDEAKAKATARRASELAAQPPARRELPLVQRRSA